MWVWAFLLGQLVEMPIYMLGLGRPGVPPHPLWMRLLAAFGATALTHPFAWLSMGRLIPEMGFWPAVLLVEAAVVLVEGAYFRLWHVPWAPLWALAANTASFAAGLLL